jgi:hypothetical protein
VVTKDAREKGGKSNIIGVEQTVHQFLDTPNDIIDIDKEKLWWDYSTLRNTSGNWEPGRWTGVRNDTKSTIWEERFNPTKWATADFRILMELVEKELVVDLIESLREVEEGYMAIATGARGTFYDTTETIMQVVGRVARSKTRLLDWWRPGRANNRQNQAFHYFACNRGERNWAKGVGWRGVGTITFEEGANVGAPLIGRQHTVVVRVVDQSSERLIEGLGSTGKKPWREFINTHRRGQLRTLAVFGHQLNTELAWGAVVFFIPFDTATPGTNSLLHTLW